MKQEEEVKRAVREKYGALARREAAAGCDAPGECARVGEDYTRLGGYFRDADLGLGCGLPTEFAALVEGETVVDLGAGAGNDAFVARSFVKESGRVIGVDMTEAMVEKARSNCRRLGFTNVEFVLGEIENLPLEDLIADVIVSNCVLNLVPDKRRAFGEIFRVLRWGGRFSISDVVTEGAWTAASKAAAESYVGCVAGACEKGDYLETIRAAGFMNVSIVKERRIEVPRELNSPDAAILSVTIYGEKLRD